MVVKADGAIDPWKYPVSLNFAFGINRPIASRLTLIALCYDAAKSIEYQNGRFDSMPEELRRKLCAH